MVVLQYLLNTIMVLECVLEYHGTFYSYIGKKISVQGCTGMYCNMAIHVYNNDAD